MRALLALSLTCAVFLSTARADDAAASSVQAMALLQLSGTAAVFDSPAVQQYLSRPPAPDGADAGVRRLQLLVDAGLHPWLPPRVWLLRARVQGPGRWESLAAELSPAASLRGYVLVDQSPLPAAETAIGLLAPERQNPGLAGLLDAYGADALVLLRDRQWTLWAAGVVRQGLLPGGGLELLPGVLAEVIAAQQQWPEARGQAVVEVDNVTHLADFAAVQAVLQALPGAGTVRLIRADRGAAWFALAAPAAHELAVALDAEPRLPAWAVADGGLGAATALTRQLGCPLLRRHWRPAAAPAGGPPVQSFQ